MGRYEHIPVFQSAYRLTFDVHKTAALFKREDKYALGQALKQQCNLILKLIILANRSDNKATLLENLAAEVEILKINFRLAMELKTISAGRYEVFVRQTDEIAKQLAGWQNWCNRQNS